MSSFATQPDRSPWPALAYDEWKDTQATLHLWTQIVGKIRLVQTPVGQSFLARCPVRHGPRAHDVADSVWGSDVRDRVRFPRPPTPDQDHRGKDRDTPVGAPCRRRFLPGAVRSAEGTGARDSDPNDAQRNPRRHAVRAGPAACRLQRGTGCTTSGARWSRPTGCSKPFGRALSASAARFTSSGAASTLRLRASPAVKRPPHRGGVPNLPDWVAREAYSHEVSSCGFWPGGEAMPYPVFYAYAYPEPGRLQVGVGAPGRRAVQLRPRRVRPPLRRGSAGSLARYDVAGVPAEHLRGGRRSRQVGSAGVRTGASGPQLNTTLPSRSSAFDRCRPGRASATGRSYYPFHGTRLSIPTAAPLGRFSLQ